jgi:hypothetical protein
LSEIFAFNKGSDSYREPEERWRYSNTERCPDRACLEKATGRTYSEETDGHICQLLKLFV